jgi:lipid A 4'-phosphatase
MVGARITICALVFPGTMLVLIIFPGIDLATSRAFYAPGIGFSHSAMLTAIHREIRYLVVAIILLSATLLAWPRERRAAIFLLVALALGPGFLVNTVFKNHWGRARPFQIVEFGGTKALTPAFIPADQCRTNCSFPAGDAAIGFFLVSGALLIESAALRRWSVAGAVAIGSALGFMRIAQGGALPVGCRRIRIPGRGIELDASSRDRRERPGRRAGPISPPAIAYCREPRGAYRLDCRGRHGGI